MTSPIASHYRRIPGGLDNAVKQAEERGFKDLFIFDADVHQGEPFSLFAKYLPEKYRGVYSNEVLLSASMDDDRAASGGISESAERGKNHQISDYDRKVSSWDRSVGGRIFRSEVRAAVRKPGLDTTRLIEMHSDEIIDIFTRRLQEIGIKRALIFPNTMLGLGGNPDFELEVALDTAYNEFMIENYLGKYPEILSCICTPANTPDKSAELIDRMGSEKGMVGVSITPSRPTLAGEESWDPIYEAAQRKGLPIVFHGEVASLAALDRFKGRHYLPVHALGFPLSLMLQLTSLVVEGVPERFPKLKFVFMEGGVTWIPWLMARLDSEYMMRRSEAPLITRLPSEYIKEFFFTQQPLEFSLTAKELESAFRAFNAGTQLVFASDYPHWDFDVPSVIWDLPFLSEQEKKNILGENARRVFRLD